MVFIGWQWDVFRSEALLGLEAPLPEPWIVGIFSFQMIGGPQHYSILRVTSMVSGSLLALGDVMVITSLCAGAYPLRCAGRDFEKGILWASGIIIDAENG